MLNVHSNTGIQCRVRVVNVQEKGRKPISSGGCSSVPRLKATRRPLPSIIYVRTRSIINIRHTSLVTVLYTHTHPKTLTQLNSQLMRGQ